MQRDEYRELAADALLRTETATIAGGMMYAIAAEEGVQDFIDEWTTMIDNKAMEIEAEHLQEQRDMGLIR